MVLVVLVVGAEELVELLLADVLILVLEQAAIPRVKRTRTETVDRDLTSTDRRAYLWDGTGPGVAHIAGSERSRLASSDRESASPVQYFS